jgi:serine phosphatase RsbU (regulator of sigma subunit)
MLVAMLRFMRGLFPVVGLLCLGMTIHAAAPAPAPASILSINALGKGTAPIDGPWQFHLGDNMAWAQPGTPDAAGVDGWEQITTDATWGAQGHPSHAGFGWYRKHLHLEPAAGTDAGFALLIPQIDDVYEIYWNGQLAGHYGKMPPDPMYFYLPPPHTFGLGPARDGVLAVRVWKAPLVSYDPAEIGGFEAAPLIGSPAAIAAAKDQEAYSWIRSQQFRFGLYLLYGLLAGLGMWMWLRNRAQWMLLAMTAYCGARVVICFLEFLRLPIPATLELGLLQPAIGIQDVGLWFLLLYLFRLNRAPRMLRFTRILAIVNIASYLLDGGLIFVWNNPIFMHWVQAADGILTVIPIVAEFYPFVLIFLALRRKLDNARWFLAIAATLDALINEARNTLDQGSRFTSWTIGDKIARPLFTFNGNAFTVTTLADTLLLAAIVYAVYQAIRETTRRQSDLEREFQSARELQQVLIPETLPMLQGYAVTSAYRPAQEVGGDFFQIIPLEGHFTGSSLVLIGDVSGKGLKAAMTVSLIVGAARSLARTTYKPAEILVGLNAQLHGRLNGGFATCLIMRLSASGRCTMSSAGHMAPILNDGEIEMEGSLPLGILAEAQYQEVAVDLHEGDHLALYTDGLLEARSRNGELFSFERLKEMFSLKTDAAQATEMAVEFGQDDDITVLTVRRLASSEESSTRLHTRVIPAVGTR